MPKFADLILPLPLQNLFTYEIPPHLQHLVQRGRRVLVQFGKKKYYAGLVLNVHDDKPDYDLKPISEAIDVAPVIRESQLSVWQWIADYYICTLGEVMKAAMPSGLKLESETHVVPNPDWEGDPDSLSPRQKEVLDFVSNHKSSSITEVGAAIGGVNPIAHIKALIDADAIFVSEELRDSYKPKTVVSYSLHRDLRSEDELFSVFAQLEKKAPKQMESLMAFLQVAGGAGKATAGVKIPRDVLANDPRISMSAMSALADKGFLSIQKVPVSRLESYDGATLPLNSLSPAQSDALNQIVSLGSGGKPVLLHGVTGSGKTEIYIHLIRRVIDQGLNVLYLLPEIALTTQITQRLRRHFGDDMVVYHSKFSDGERVEVWDKCLGPNPPRLILGVRSSVLLPLHNLGLVIVDEEHEGSYKQYDPAPRYNARDMALVIAMLHSNARPDGPRTMVVLGSATPSLESFVNAQQGKYALVSLLERHQGVSLPSVEPINMVEARNHKATQSMFSLRLKEVISHAIERKEQVILFQNRRGFSPVVECKLCAWVPKCKNCDVSLTYHKTTNQLVCHYCGFFALLPQTCPACGNPSLQPQGFGTEKIEEACHELFPSARVVRMDLDTAKSRKAYEQIISDFAAHKHDILIGTQMVSKGLDFEGVSTVGIMNADALLSMSDFRADERAFQLMAQVSGRAGRRGSQGHVFIQVNKPEHPVIANVVNNDYDANAKRLLAERQLYKFPPFYRLISLVVKHRDAHVDYDAARNLAAALQSRFGHMVSGPIPPLVGRISNLFLQEISIKMPRSAQPRDVKRIMMDCVNAILADQRFRGTIVRIDVDPY